MVNAGQAYHEYHNYPMSLCLYHTNILNHTNILTVNAEISIAFPTLYKTTKFEKCYFSYQKTLSTAV
jgi:hypothetical protein